MNRFFLLLFASSLATSLDAANIGIWANNGEDKICQEELRLTVDKQDVRNSVFDGRKIKLMAARGETVAFNLIIETPELEIRDCNVSISDLKSDSGSIPATKRDGDDGLFDFRERYLELFLVRYLQIKGCSTLSYEHYDERLVPERFRRPHDKDGNAEGKWTDRPDHDRHYPDIAVPIELEPDFDVAAGKSQAIWGDLFVPAGISTGIYRGNLTVDAKNIEPVIVPIELEVINFTLPDLPTARSMLYVSQEDINRRYVGKKWLDEAPADDILTARKVLDRHFQMAHRHRISIIHEHTPIGLMDDRWQDKLDGSLFTPANEYDGVGVGVGNNVYSIGTYGAWPWKDGDKDTMWRSTDRWVSYFDEKGFETPTDYFLYLIDESSEYQKIETWAKWVLENPGPGKRLKTLATMNVPSAYKLVPSLTLPCSTVAYGIPEHWKDTLPYYQYTKDRSFYLYNGGRAGSGCLATEDDGVAFRNLGWCQFKSKAARWFIWQGTYYENFQGGTGETKLFSNAHTFGGKTRVDEALGETGGNYNNGDGVMFYPGTDKVYPDESYDVSGPIASLRLKHWRRGLQDYEYLHAANQIAPEKVKQIVDRTIPKVLWEVGVSDITDPTWNRTDISWSTNPDDWENARRELADIITNSNAGDDS